MTSVYFKSDITMYSMLSIRLYKWDLCRPVKIFHSRLSSIWTQICAQRCSGMMAERKDSKCCNLKRLHGCMLSSYW